MNKLMMVIGYNLFLIMFLYVSLKALIFSAMSDSFINAQFIITILLIIIVLWTLGLLLKKSSIVKDSKVLFTGSSAVSFLIVLAIFWNF